MLINHCYYCSINEKNNGTKRKGEYHKITHLPGIFQPIISWIRRTTKNLFVNHLDIPSRNRFEQALSQFEGTILAVIHDRYFIQAFAREDWQMDAGKIQYLQ
jgi:hypothetical protein